MTEKKSPTKRRIFIKANSRIHQLFSFEQGNDGSIYCSCPDFKDAIWFSFGSNENGPFVASTKNIGEGKISFHASGMVTVRSHNNPQGHKLIINGNPLLDKTNGRIGVRHLFTVFPKKPSFEPLLSPLFNRESDYCLNTNEELKPFVIIFFAIPQQGVAVNFLFDLHIDDMVSIPSDFLGSQNFGLRYHNVFWFAYRTKHMDNWPKYSQFFYHDGYSFPVFIGTGTGTCRVELRQPKYIVTDQELTIICHEEYPEGYTNP